MQNFSTDVDPLGFLFVHQNGKLLPGTVTQRFLLSMTTWHFIIKLVCYFHTLGLTGIRKLGFLMKIAPILACLQHLLQKFLHFSR